MAQQGCMSNECQRLIMLHAPAEIRSILQIKENISIRCQTLKVVCNGKMTGLYCSLVLVMNIGMCDLVILCVVYPLQEF